MAQQYSRSPLRIPLADTNRIKSGLDRAEKILQKGIAIPPKYVPPIKDISVHGRWDGIVGHPVDVKISLTIAAQSNISHAVITGSHPLVEAAQIHSVTESSCNVPIDEHRPSSSVIRSSGNRVVVTEHEAKHENDVMPETWTDSCNSNSGQGSPPHKKRSFLVGQRSVYGTEDYGWPLLPAVSSQEKQRLPVGGRSVYGTDPFQESLPAGPNDVMPASLVGQRSVYGTDPFQESLSAGPNEVMPASLVGQRSVYGTDPFQESLSAAPPAQTPTGHAAYDIGHRPTHPGPHAYDWSGDTLVTSEAQLYVKLGLPTEIPLSVPRKRASPGKKPCGFPSLTEVFITDLALPRQDQRLADSTSSEQESCQSTNTVLLYHDQGPRRDLQAILDPESGISAPKHGQATGPRFPEGKGRRIRSRSLGHLKHVQTRTKPDESQSSPKSGYKAVTLGRARGRQLKHHTSNTRTPTRSRIQTLQFNKPSSNNPGTEAQDVDNLKSADARNDTLEGRDESPDEDPGYSASVDSDHSNTPIQHSTRKKRDATSPDISDLPWVRRDISSSKYFPEETDTPVPARQTTEAPLWINYEGNLVVCFPTNVVADSLYEVEVHAKIHLSDTDEDGWQTFSVPGLPLLDRSQKPGRMSFSLTSPLHQYRFDQSPLQETFTCGPDLVVGCSRFGASALARLRNEAFDLTNSHPLRFTLLHPIVGQARKAASRPRSFLLGRRTAPTKKVEKVSPPYKDDNLFPAYFGGLACANDPMDNEDLPSLAWGFKLSVSRTMNGKLQCRLKMDLPPGAKPFLRIDARDWTPNFALVNRRLAASTDWQETEVGDIVLQKVTPRDAGETTKVEIHFEERAIDQQVRLKDEQHRLVKRLPNIVDKVILGGLLSCYLAKALITLTDASGEEFSWRTDSSNTRDDIALPKLGIGYLMHLSLVVPAPEEENDSEDDLETISDIESSLDKATTPRPNKEGKPDAGPVDADVPEDVESSAADPPANPDAGSQDNTKDDLQDNTQDDLPAPEPVPRPSGRRPPNRQFWGRFRFNRTFRAWVIVIVILLCGLLVGGIYPIVRITTSGYPSVPTPSSTATTLTTTTPISGSREGETPVGTTLSEPSRSSVNSAQPTSTTISTTTSSSTSTSSPTSTQTSTPTLIPTSTTTFGNGQETTSQTTSTYGITPGHGPRPTVSGLHPAPNPPDGGVDVVVQTTGGVVEWSTGAEVVTGEKNWVRRAWRDRVDRALGWWEVEGQ